MSKLGCICGHVIRDQTDFIAYKARFVRDQDDENYHTYTNDVAAFIEAIKADKRAEWIRNYFSNSYPTATSDAHIINDIIMKYELKFESILYQCVNCGRVKIQIQNKNLFASFIPEDENFQDIFKPVEE